MSIKEAIKKILPCFVLEAISAHKRMKHRELISTRNSEVIKELLKGSRPIKLELGAGDRSMEGWTSVDMNDNCALNLDLTEPIPFPDNSVSMIYSSHVLEHFKYTELIKLIEECLRILKPGGLFSASVPNARIYLNAYHDPDNFKPEIFCRYKPAYHYNSKIDYVNYMAYMDGHHQYMFDEENLLEVIKRAGFRNAELRDFDEVLDLEARDFQTIYVKARK
jgi:predicted SAM-dependent methyltransferase